MRTVTMVTTTMTRTTTVTQRSSWKRSVENRSLSRPKRIAASSDRVDQGLLGAALQLAAQPVDVHLDDVGGPFPVGLPEVFAQHLARDDLPGMAHQHLQNAELGRRQLDLDAPACDAPGRQVERQIADLEHRRWLGARTPANRLDAGQQLGHRERLDEVIVRAAGQARYPVVP